MLQFYVNVSTLFEIKLRMMQAIKMGPFLYSQATVEGLFIRIIIMCNVASVVGI